MLPSPEQYAAMLDGAAEGGYAFPAINVTSSQTLNAAMRGFAEARTGSCRSRSAALATWRAPPRMR